MRARVEKMPVLGWNKSHAYCLELGEDTVPRMKVANCLQLIGSKINACFLGGESFSNVIGLLPILCKQLVTLIRGKVSLPNSKQAASHNPLTAGFFRNSRAFFSLGQFSSFHHKFLFRFAADSSNSLVTVAVSFSDELSAPDYMGTNTQ